MTGISEILVLVFLICIILILPRMFRQAPPARKAGKKKRFRLSAAMRSGIVLSGLLPLLSAMILRPWTGENVILFAVTGILPVVVSWSIVWILSGRKG